jgi:hypothetical protein
VLEAVAKEAANTDELSAIATSNSVRSALENYPTLIQAQIRDTLRVNHERLAPSDDQPDPPDDPLADLLAEVEAMDLTTIAGLRDNAAWQAKTADLFPTDADRLDEAVTDRRAHLQTQEISARDDHSPPEANPGP